jgi:hypothetical protein
MIGKPPTRIGTQVYRWLDFNAYRHSTGSGLLTRKMRAFRGISSSQGVLPTGSPPRRTLGVTAPGVLRDCFGAASLALKGRLAHLA